MTYAAAGETPWQRAFRSRSGRAGLLLLLGIMLLALVLPPLLDDPYAQPDLLAGTSQAPSGAHPFGTDGLSRDVLSRTVTGARWSLGIALPAVALATMLGTLVGLAAGTLGGVPDTVLMRLVDALLAIPRLFVLLLLLAATDRLPAWGIAAAIGATGWFGLARLVRGEAQRLRGAEFAQAAHALGASRTRIALRHLLPNVAGPISVAATVLLADTILLEAGLGFLGLGIQPPTPTWGAMLLEGRSTLATAPWASIFPGLALVLTVLGAHLSADALRAALDPREAA
jgi:peptide/nickel transport system permease protein